MTTEHVIALTGATDGLGRALAERLADRRDQLLILHGRSPERLAGLRDDLRDRAAEVVTWPRPGSRRSTSTTSRSPTATAGRARTAGPSWLSSLQESRAMDDAYSPELRERLRTLTQSLSARG